MQSVFANIIPESKVVDEQPQEKVLAGMIVFNAGKCNLRADLLLPHSAPPQAVPICGSVFSGDDRIWHFQKEEFDGRVHLLSVDDVPTLVFVGRRRKAVEKVVSLPHLVEGEPQGLKCSTQLKLGAALKLGVDYHLTSLERQVYEKLRTERAERLKRDREAELAAQTKARQERQAAREAKRAAILGRQEYALISAKGKRLYGVPVEAEEWPCLKDGTWCVLVAGYDSVTGNCEELLEHFVVAKKHGKVGKRSVTTDISFADNRHIEPPAPQGVILVEFAGDIHEVPLYTREDVELLKRLKVATIWAVKAADGLAVGRITVDDDGQVRMQQIKDAVPFAPISATVMSS